ncbi:MAG: hypothetical protein ACE5JK_02785 [Candidatus Omnitrophota bacterium]
MLYYIFTVDGDWKEYFDVSLPEQKRFPKRKQMEELIKREIILAGRSMNGRFVHFIHTSPRARTFFLGEPFIKLWKHIVRKGGDIGVHCHEDDLDKACYFFKDTSRMGEVISQQVRMLRKKGLKTRAYRGGYLAFDANLIKILEENELQFDLSCEPERYLLHKGQLVSDWRDAPTSLYRMSYDDHRKEGDSDVFEIPIGASKGQYLYFEKSGPKELEQVASDLKDMSEKESRHIIVSVLTHSYEYETADNIEQVEEKINVLKQYGHFINLKEALKLI